MSPIQQVRRVFARKEPLTPMTPVEQLRSGGLPLRLAQLLVGLWLYGASMAMLVRGRLGLPAWDVFHVGVQRHWGASFGTVVIVTSFAVLLLWIPLRQWPGLGTLANSVLIGVAADATLRVLGPQDGAATRWGLMLGGILLNGLAGALYIGSQLGPGPRDGLMTGIARRTGRSIRLVRTGLEIAVLTAGWLLGGVVGVGTILYAVGIGPVVQALLPVCTRRVDLTRAQGGGELEGR